MCGINEYNLNTLSVSFVGKGLIECIPLKIFVADVVVVAVDQVL